MGYRWTFAEIFQNIVRVDNCRILVSHRTDGGENERA
jgi:hypothetical protein